MEKDNNNLEIYDNVFYNNAINFKIWILVEEIGKLLNAIAKLKRNKCTKADVITELADVHIMVEEMALLYGWEDFVKEKELKIEWLEGRLEKAVQ